MKEIVMICGMPASGKTTIALDEFPHYFRLNRDSLGGTLADIAARLESEFSNGHKGFVLDNTYSTASVRRPVLEIAKKHGAKLRCIHLDSSIEDSQYNVCERMVRKYGKLLMPDELSELKDPNAFPISVLFSYRKCAEMPSSDEGYSDFEVRKFARQPQGKEYKNKAAIFDYDGTLRRTISGAEFPKHPDDVAALPGRSAKLKELKSQGYRLLGISNQSAVAKGDLTYELAVQCFERTNELLGVDIEYKFCPHRAAPLSCYCRKPAPGLAIQFIEKYKLDRSQTFFVGDMTSDKTMASRALITYHDQEKFFS